MNTPEAWIEPVLPKIGWRSRSASGSERTTSGRSTVDRDGDDVSSGVKTSSRLSVPQTPQADETDVVRLDGMPPRRAVEVDRDDVVALLLRQGAVDAVGDLVRAVVEADHSVGQQEAGGQLEVGPGRPHHDGGPGRRMARPGQPDLHRLLGHDRVGPTA